MRKSFEITIDVPPFDHPKSVWVAASEGRPTLGSKALVLFKSSALVATSAVFYGEQALGTYMETGKYRIIPIILASALAVYTFHVAQKNYRKLTYTSQFQR